MDLGRIVYRLQAMDNCRVPVVNGKLLHGAIFKILKEQSAELATALHDTMQVKPFGVAPLHVEHDVRGGSQYSLRQGEIVEIFITAFSAKVLNAFLKVPEGYVLQIGTANFKLQAVSKDSSEHPEACLLTKEEFMVGIPAEIPELITLDYISPTTFRIWKSDYPFPEPRLVWNSLAVKWKQYCMPGNIDQDEIKDLAMQVVPWKWEGHTVRMKYNAHISVTGFIGSFTYSLFNLTQEQRKLFYQLACFAEYAGVGRMTAQGMGQVRLR